MTGLVGRSAEVSVAIPAGGVGQITLSIGGERTEHIARSADGSAVARRGGRDHGSQRRIGDRRAGRQVVREVQMNRLCLGLRIFRRGGRARRPARIARRLCGDGAVRAELHQGAAVDRRDLLRPQARAHRREGQQVDRRASASCAAAPPCGCRCWRTVAYLSLNIISIPLQNPARLHEGRRGRHRRSGRQRQDRRRRRVAARRGGAFSRHDRRSRSRA